MASVLRLNSIFHYHVADKTNLVSGKILKGVYFEVFSFPLLSAHVTPTGCLGILGKGGPEDMKVAFVTKKIWASPAFLLSQTKSCRC